MVELISRGFLLSEYDRLHEGEPGLARKLIEDAPEIEFVSGFHISQLVFVATLLVKANVMPEDIKRLSNNFDAAFNIVLEHWHEALSESMEKFEKEMAGKFEARFGERKEND